MTVPAHAPRSGFGGVAAVWAVAAVLAVVIGLTAPEQARGAWMPVGLAGCIVVAFVVQLFSGRAEGFLRRVAASVLGALVVMALIGLGLSLASLIAAVE